jgi:predicted RNase H-like HicB family nuclease
MHRFPVITENANGNYSSYSPDLPGCVASGATREESEANMPEAIDFHIEGLMEEGLPNPESDATATYVAVDQT